MKKEVAYVGKNKGKTVYYAAPVSQDKITSKQVEDRIINLTALSSADVRSAITVWLFKKAFLCTVCQCLPFVERSEV